MDTLKPKRIRKTYTVDDPPRALGRPRIYPQSDKSAYNKRGKLVNRILFIKHKYNLKFPTADAYTNKNDDILIDIIVQLEADTSRLKYDIDTK